MTLINVLDPNTNICEVREAWTRDWARLVDASESVGSDYVRHLYDDRPEDVDPQVWEASVRRDYINNMDWFCFEPLETAALVDPSGTLNEATERENAIRRAKIAGSLDWNV